MIVLCVYREQYNHALSNKMFTLPLPSSSVSDEAAVSGNGEDGGDRRSVSVTYQLEQHYVDYPLHVSGKDVVSTLSGILEL